jgi:hypothetical protein
MRVARLLTPFILATALISPAAMSTAQANAQATTTRVAVVANQQMDYDGTKFVQPIVMLRKAETLTIKNVSNITRTITVALGQFSETATIIGNGGTHQFAPWQQPQAPVGAYIAREPGNASAIGVALIAP